MNRRMPYDTCPACDYNGCIACEAHRIAIAARQLKIDLFEIWHRRLRRFKIIITRPKEYVCPLWDEGRENQRERRKAV